MISLGWKKKAERLRMVILSAAHQSARELPPGISGVLEIFARVARTGDGRGLQEEIAGLPQDDCKPLWEPIEVYGWAIQATLYLREGALWWLVHAERKNGGAPSDKDGVLLDKILDHLGAVPLWHMIIGPSSSPPGEPRLPFGWWTWQNRWPLYDIQVNKSKKRDQDKIRIVPQGSRETEGYQGLFAASSDEEGGEADDGCK